MSSLNPLLEERSGTQSVANALMKSWGWRQWNIKEVFASTGVCVCEVVHSSSRSTVLASPQGFAFSAAKWICPDPICWRKVAEQISAFPPAFSWAASEHCWILFISINSFAEFNYYPAWCRPQTGGEMTEVGRLVLPQSGHRPLQWHQLKKEKEKTFSYFISSSLKRRIKEGAEGWNL